MHKRMIKRRLLSVAAALVFLLAVSGCSAEEKGSVYMNINPEKAKETAATISPPTIVRTGVACDSSPL